MCGCARCSWRTGSPPASWTPMRTALQRPVSRAAGSIGTGTQRPTITGRRPIAAQLPERMGGASTTRAPTAGAIDASGIRAQNISQVDHAKILSRHYRAIRPGLHRQSRRVAPERMTKCHSTMSLTPFSRHESMVLLRKMTEFQELAGRQESLPVAHEIARNNAAFSPNVSRISVL